MIDRDTDPSALPGRAWNADWVDRKAATIGPADEIADSTAVASASIFSERP